MKKKLVSAILMFLIFTSSAFAISASPSTQSVKLDGRITSISAYLINGNNYFKIRDLAAILNKTESRFDVGYDSENNAVQITSGKVYEGNEKDLRPLPVDSQEAILSPQKIMLNGKRITVKAYLINGNNYFMLRDLGDKLDFKVDYDSKTRSVLIESKKTAQNFVAERIKLQAFPIEGFQVRKYLYDIRFTVGNNENANLNFDPVTGKMVILTDTGDNLQIGNMEIHAEQGGKLSELKVDMTGVLTYDEMQKKGIDLSKTYSIIIFLKNDFDGKLIPLLILEYNNN